MLCHDEIIVDSFAGGGGASTGIELAIGRSPDIAVNHDPEAIAMHAIITRFWSRVDMSGPILRAELGPCWLWTGARNVRRDGSKSYGKFAVSKKTIVLAHRFAFETSTAKPGGAKVCHACDNPPCVRPSHLFLGTQAENLRDMRAKGRGWTRRFPSGTAHPNAKLTPERIAEVRQLRATGLSLAKIGASVGLHASTVHDIVTGKTWRSE